jgi:hypothetical protein
MVSDSQQNDASLPSQCPSQRALPEPSLDTLALAEWLAERHAAGDTPRLTALIAGLPHAAGALADAMMAESDELADDMVVADAGAPGRLEPIPLSPGTQRGVAALFGSGNVSPLKGYGEYRAAGARDEVSVSARVAELQADYSAVTGDVAGLLALASQQGIDAETLAAHVMLSPEALRWLDSGAIPPEQQPDALVFHLAGALAVTRERIREALAQGQTRVDTPDVMGILTTSQSLTVAQRSYWATLLSLGS